MAAVMLAWSGRRAGETLAAQHAQFALGDVQPRAVFGRVHQLDPVGHPQPLGRIKRLIQQRHPMRVEVVTHQRDFLGIGVMRIIDQRLDLLRPIDGRAPITHTHVAPTAQRLGEHPHVAHTFANIFMVHAPIAGVRSDRRARFADKLLGLFVHANHRPPRIVRPRIHL